MDKWSHAIHGRSSGPSPCQHRRAATCRDPSGPYASSLPVSILVAEYHRPKGVTARPYGTSQSRHGRMGIAGVPFGTLAVGPDDIGGPRTLGTKDVATRIANMVVRGMLALAGTARTGLASSQGFPSVFRYIRKPSVRLFILLSSLEQYYQLYAHIKHHTSDLCP
jgi:hypothetical protein